MSDTKPLPDNVVPFGKREKKETQDKATEGTDLEEQNKDYYQKLKDAAHKRRTTNNSNVTRDYRLKPKS